MNSRQIPRVGQCIDNATSRRLKDTCFIRRLDVVHFWRRLGHQRTLLLVTTLPILQLALRRAVVRTEAVGAQMHLLLLTSRERIELELARQILASAGADDDGLEWRGRWRRPRRKTRIVKRVAARLVPLFPIFELALATAVDNNLALGG